jgi:hypothetical protein
LHKIRAILTDALNGVITLEKDTIMALLDLANELTTAYDTAIAAAGADGAAAIADVAAATPVLEALLAKMTPVPAPAEPVIDPATGQPVA